MSFIQSREKKDVRGQFLLTLSNFQKLKKKAEELNTSMNEIINRLIREFIDKIK